MSPGWMIGIVLVGIVTFIVLYVLVHPSRRRFAWNLLRQLPYLIPRYFV